MPHYAITFTKQFLYFIFASKPVVNLFDAFAIFCLKSHVAGLTECELVSVSLVLPPREKRGAYAKHINKQFSSLNKALEKHPQTFLLPQQ